MKQKTGQVKFGETIGIIIIVYIILVVGFVWYNNINSKDIQKQLETNQKNKAFEKYNYILKLSLLHKSKLGYIDQEIDKISLETMSQYTQNEKGKEYFRKRLGTSTIQIELFDYEQNSIQNITIYNNTPNNNKKFETINFKTLMPIYDGIENINYIGIIKIQDHRIKN